MPRPGRSSHANTLNDAMGDPASGSASSAVFTITFHNIFRSLLLGLVARERRLARTSHPRGACGSVDGSTLSVLAGRCSETPWPQDEGPIAWMMGKYIARAFALRGG